VTTGAEAELLERDERFTPPPPSPLPPPSDISTDAYRIDHFPEYQLLEQQHALGPALGLENPFFAVHEGISGATTRREGRDLLSFASYNYLGFSGHPAVSAAAKAAIDTFGTSVSASRIVSGEKPLHGELERALADFLGTEDAVAFVSGHATNVSAIATLVKEGDLVVHDALAHDSIVQGARLSGARHRSFPHGDWQALDQILRLGRDGHRRALVAVEGVYSMDGDIPDLPRLVEVARRHRALLMVDEAHSLGVLGRTGRGIAEHFGLPRSSVDVWMGTLSKSLAGCGGYVAGSRALVKLLRYRAPGFVFSVGMSPPDAAAALAALGELRAHPELVARLQRQARLFLHLLRERGIDTGSSADSAIVPCIVRDSVRTARLAQSLLGRGINAPPIFHPAVEEAQARIRFFITALHTDEQLHRAADVLAEELAKLDSSAHSTALSRASSSGNR